jgi:transcriptional regulator with XRE-family HTH domain
VLTYPRQPPSVCRVSLDQLDWLLQYRQDVGDRIRVQRELRNRTQWQVCDAANIPRSTYQEIERGTTDARLSWLALIAATLDVPVAHLVGPNEPRPPARGEQATGE